MTRNILPKSDEMKIRNMKHFELFVPFTSDKKSVSPVASTLVNKLSQKGMISDGYFSPNE